MECDAAAILRIFSISFVSAIFVTDYALDLWIRPVPSEVYLLLLALSIGIDARTLRSIILSIIQNRINPPDNNKRE